MTMPKWTPGPRTVQEVIDEQEFHATVWNDQFICVGEFHCSADDSEAVEATRADAVLDAAAPRMYEALSKFPRLELAESLPKYIRRVMDWWEKTGGPALIAADGTKAVRP